MFNFNCTRAGDTLDASSLYFTEPMDKFVSFWFVSFHLVWARMPAGFSSNGQTALELVLFVWRGYFHFYSGAYTGSASSMSTGLMF